MGLLDTIRGWFRSKDEEAVVATSADEVRDIDPSDDVTRSSSGADLWSDDGTRRGLYAAYDELERAIPYVGIALDVRADLAGTGAQVQDKVLYDYKTREVRHARNTFTVRSASGEIDLELGEVCEQTRYPGRARGIMRDMLKYGDRFDECVYGPAGLLRFMRLEPETVKRHEGKSGRLKRPYPFTQDDPNSQEVVAFERYQIAHYRADSPDVGYGVKNSVLYNLLTVGREYNLMNAALTLSRLTDPDGQLVVYVDVTGFKGKTQRAYFKSVQQSFKTTRRLDSSGRITVQPNALRQGEPLFIQVSESRKLGKVEKVAGTGGVKDIKDIEYKRDLFLSGLGVPKMAYGMEVPYAMRGAADEQMRTVQRACRQLREDFETVAVEVFTYALLAMGVQWEFLREQELIFDWPALTQDDEIAFLQLYLLRTQIAAIMQTNGWLPPVEVMIRYLRFTPDEADYLLAAARRSVELIPGNAKAVPTGGIAGTAEALGGGAGALFIPAVPHENAFSSKMDALLAGNQSLQDNVNDVRASLSELVHGVTNTRSVGAALERMEASGALEGLAGLPAVQGALEKLAGGRGSERR